MQAQFMAFKSVIFHKGLARIIVHFVFASLIVIVLIIPTAMASQLTIISYQDVSQGFPDTYTMTELPYDRVLNSSEITSFINLSSVNLANFYNGLPIKVIKTLEVLYLVDFKIVTYPLSGKMSVIVYPDEYFNQSFRNNANIVGELPEKNNEVLLIQPAIRSLSTTNALNTSQLGKEFFVSYKTYHKNGTMIPYYTNFSKITITGMLNYYFPNDYQLLPVQGGGETSLVNYEDYIVVISYSQLSSFVENQTVLNTNYLRPLYYSSLWYDIPELLHKYNDLFVYSSHYDEEINIDNGGDIDINLKFSTPGPCFRFIYWAEEIFHLTRIMSYIITIPILLSIFLVYSSAKEKLNRELRGLSIRLFRKGIRKKVIHQFLIVESLTLIAIAMSLLFGLILIVQPFIQKIVISSLVYYQVKPPNITSEIYSKFTRDITMIFLVCISISLMVLYVTFPRIKEDYEEDFDIDNDDNNNKKLSKLLLIIFIISSILLIISKVVDDIISDIPIVTFLKDYSIFIVIFSGSYTISLLLKYLLKIVHDKAISLADRFSVKFLFYPSLFLIRRFNNLKMYMKQLILELF